MTFDDYEMTSFDELIAPDGAPRAEAQALVDHLERLGIDELAMRQHAADVGIEAAGITFTVYSEGAGIDRAWPFDIVPRVIARRTWDRIDAGLVQRLQALNRFIDDVYNDRRIFAEGIVPWSLVENSPGYRRQCEGVHPAHGVWAHICGSDLVRGDDGTFYVLEDNLRVPSGVSYMLENRETTKRVFPELFANQSILPVDAYPDRLRRVLGSLSPEGETATIAVLTPGVYNSAYFEHSFLARQMGVALVEGNDLQVDDDLLVTMRTIGGPVPVDVIYRRVDDEFLDPLAFRPDSALGCLRLMEAWRAGTVAIANAPGTGVADDKAVYAYVPDMIRFYLDAEPILANVPTYHCADPDDRAYVLDHLAELVVKPANESGGTGIVIGPKAGPAELAEVGAAIAATPRRHPARHIPRQNRHDQHQGALMLLSRTAENLYWLGRHLERIETVARIIAEHTKLLVDLPVEVDRDWGALLAITGTELSHTDRYGRCDESSVICHLVADIANPTSLVRTAANARENLRVTRQLLPAPLWEAVDGLRSQLIAGAPLCASRSERLDLCFAVIESCQRIVGIVSGTMGRDDTFRFHELGRTVERCDMTTRVLDVRAAGLLSQSAKAPVPPADRSPYEDVRWMGVLRALGAQHMFTRSVPGPTDADSVVTFLIDNEDFPRSVAHCLGTAAGLIVHLPRSEAVVRTVHDLKREIAERPERPMEAATLRVWLDEAQRGIGALHHELTETYFTIGSFEAPAGARQALV